MAFVVSAGQLASLDRAPMTAPMTVALSTSVAMAYEAIWRTQPQVRTVISFLARNIAQIGLHTYRRVSDTDRQRLTDHPLAQLIDKPNPRTTRYRLIDSLVHDLGIFDNAYLAKVRGDGGRPNGLLRLPPQLVTPIGDNAIIGAEGYELRGSRGKRVLDPDQVLHFRGYNPVDPRSGSSPIETLRRILAEEYQAAAYREQLWRNGARFGGYIRRPADAPDWSSKARERFRANWGQQYTGDGPNAGGTPVLEDGMEWVQGGMTPEQAQYLEARKLTREEVAAAFHVPLPMVGILDHATYSNIVEQHKQLYQDTLGPWLIMLCEEIELQLLPDMADRDGVYLEFNLAEKLRGSFEEQATQLQTAVGAPWLTRNEARARQNLPQIDGGDELVTPLNVLVGGQASPTDSAPVPGQSADAMPHAKTVIGRVDEHAVDVARASITGFFQRQERALIARLGSGKSDWWYGPRWDGELVADLQAVAEGIVEHAGRTILAGMGKDAAGFDVAGARGAIFDHVKQVAEQVNASTREDVAAAIGGHKGEDRTAVVRDLFAAHAPARTLVLARTLATAMTALAAEEAARQSAHYVPIETEV